MKFALTLTLLFTSLLHGKKPNIILIMTDDQSVETISAFGTQNVETPNIDALIKRGCSFTNAYTMGSWSGKSDISSRTTIMTGRFLWNAMRSKKSNDPLILESFKKAGYDTYATGKWGVEGATMEKAFDHVLDPRPNELKTDPSIKGEFTPWKREFGAYWEGEKHVTDITGESAVTLLNKASAQPQKKPFFLYVGFNAPKAPWQAQKRRHQPSRLKNIVVPPNVKKAHFFYKNKKKTNITTEFVADRYREIYAMVEQVDEQVGHMMEALEKTGQYENTIIVFMSANGSCVGENGLIGNSNLTERSIKAPLIIAGPKVPKNKFIESRIYLADVMPTLLQLADIKRPKSCQFRSLTPQMNGQEPQTPSRIYTGLDYRARAIIVNDYKLALFRRNDKRYMRLYDLFEDPFELKDISNKTNQKDRINELLEHLTKMEKSTGSDNGIKDRYLPESWK